MRIQKSYLLLVIACLISFHTHAQTKAKTGIYVDRQGVMRWEKDNSEAAFFGVNYTVPFAYGYRAVKRTGISAEQAIKDDVYHFSRLGLDAFRVHVWDTELSDSLGNLKNNEHLRLFDFLIAELKKRKIKTLVTPIAFWGNGYPEKDEDRGGFSSKYGKKNALVTEAAFVAQENYLKQFFQHKNQYTHLTYQDDPDVLAAEINNEPQHSGLKERTTEYINRMVKAVRSTGFTKPIFYNISESPKYADAIVKADVQGHSFQWYPTGLVAGRMLKGNFLPNVSKYTIPFDTIPAFKNRAKMVYEFDAGDVLGSYLYPAMARSFRTAGFQWATQFAYDPMATAFENTEYQTHYLNLAYTPAKAISLLIASKAFHLLPRLKAYASDTVFGAFNVSYQKSLSQMNTAAEFYYSNSTASLPVNKTTLKHVAGVGSSTVVNYTGSGAYFIDQIAPGIWRLEVMPDATHVKDPFERTAPNREVTAITWASQQIHIALPDLGNDFKISGLNEGNQFSAQAIKQSFTVKPGVYLLRHQAQQKLPSANQSYGAIKLGEFVAPKASAVSGLALQDFRDKTSAVLGNQSILEVFNPQINGRELTIYNPNWNNRAVDFVAGEKAGQQVIRLNPDTTNSNSMVGFQCYFGNKLNQQATFSTLVVRGRVINNNVGKMKIGLLTANGLFFAAEGVLSNQFTTIEIPLSSLKPDSQILLPRPYPGFLPLYGQTASAQSFKLATAESLQLTTNSRLEIESIYLK
jgi:hypothetical protein